MVNTEAGVDLAKLAGTAPVATIIEILLLDGHMGSSG
ncbi:MULTISPECIES: 3,4-dihydroxy-2-butanone-4-phosphate synthase [Fructobacillus]|jgi:3,4-dihydroxy 2-butanone 4-phosphate synthase / GTP cyclohydrolase II|nr:3,4-dihydroxy-2-butanone-4-phosphate synthase [Fructobacillus sp. EFB-N1]KMK53935.1 bifunctional 3,4-dihydroxy-2-butanone 4-phosphate synthase/GTP cyclohydrolase II protein [Fructobacillus sp. EFB-N1]CAK1231440.1 3 [Fructobacillus cardui] [Fructobacillus cardui]CAK1252977.1 3 [Fructobacillus cardui] [Fructobacillus cardui]